MHRGFLPLELSSMQQWHHAVISLAASANIHAESSLTPDCTIFFGVAGKVSDRTCLCLCEMKVVSPAIRLHDECKHRSHPVFIC
jgi:hypothetical protein